MIQEKEKLFIYDFCGTIYSSNTSLDFISYYFKTCSIIKKTKNLFFWILAKFLKDLKLISGNGYMKIRVKALRNEKHIDLDIAASIFIKILDDSKRIDSVYNDIVDRIDSGEKVVVLSNTFDFLLPHFLPGKKILRVGSKLKFENSIFSGKYIDYVNETGKLSTLRNYYSDEVIARSYFITDNMKADKELFDFVSEAVFYSPSNI